MRFWSAAAMLLLACSRRDVVAVPDRVDAPPPKKVAPAPAPKPEREIVGGQLVDLDTRAVVHVLSKAAPTFSALDESSAYLVDGVGEVHAFDLASGEERWKARPPRCSQLAASDGELYCVDDTHVHALAKSTGALRTIAGTKSIAQLIGVGTHLIVTRAGGELESFAEGSSAVVGTAATPLHAWPRMIARGDDVCGAAHAAGGVFAGCWSATLVSRWTKSITLAKPADPPHTTFDVRAFGPDFLVVGTWWGAKAVQRAAIVRLSDGLELTRVEDDIAAVVSRDGKTLDGLISLHKGLRLLEPSGAVRWTSSVKTWGESAATVLHGSDVIVATWHPGSSGAELHAFDAAGKTLWSATPTLPPIAHSAYINHVELSMRAGSVAMRGHEAAFEYLALFDPEPGPKPGPKAGTSLLNVVQNNW
ncbi:MAG: PQQ-binding-like beta-propeller repeat protein [Deltaproteobacteria bacterium]|nr:PQQ-binding-like beta-propeller repeat protein [Deltaproteobacteria bacterium]